MTTHRFSLLILLVLGFFHASSTQCPQILATMFDEEHPEDVMNFVQITWAEQVPHDHIKDRYQSIVYMEASVRLRGDFCRACGTYYGAFFNSIPRCGYTCEPICGLVDVTEGVPPEYLLCRIFETNEELLTRAGTTKLEELERISSIYNLYLLANSSAVHHTVCAPGTFFGRILHK